MFCICPWPTIEAKYESIYQNKMKKKNLWITQSFLQILIHTTKLYTSHHIVHLNSCCIEHWCGMTTHNNSRTSFDARQTSCPIQLHRSGVSELAILFSFVFYFLPNWLNPIFIRRCTIHRTQIPTPAVSLVNLSRCCRACTYVCSSVNHTRGLHKLSWLMDSIRLRSLVQPNFSMLPPIVRKWCPMSPSRLGFNSKIGWSSHCHYNFQNI